MEWQTQMNTELTYTKMYDGKSTKMYDGKSTKMYDGKSTRWFRQKLVKSGAFLPHIKREFRENYLIMCVRVVNESKLNRRLLHVTTYYHKDSIIYNR